MDGKNDRQQLTDSYSSIVNDEYKKAMAFTNWAFSSEDLSEGEDGKSKKKKLDPSTKEKVQKEVTKLKDALAACKSAKDIAAVADGLLKMLNRKVNEAEDDATTAALKELLATNRQLLLKVEQLEKKQGEMTAKMKKLRGSTVKKSLVLLMKYGTLALLVFYGWTKVPKIAQDAVKAEVTAVKDSISVIADAVDGNTKTINKISQDLVKTAEELAKKIEKSHEDIAKTVDTALSLTGKLANMFLSQEQLDAKCKKQVAQLQADMEQWKSMDSSRDKAEQAQKIEAGIEAVGGKEDGDASVQKLKLALKTAWHDISLRMTKEAGGKASVDESVDAEFLRLTRIVEEASLKFKCIVLALNESTSLTKEEQLQKAMYEVWDKLQSSIKSPESAEKWYLANKDKILKLIDDPHLPMKAKKPLKKAFYCLLDAVEKHPTEEAKKSFIKKHWLKVLMLVFFIALFLVGGAATHGFAVLNAGAIGAISNAQLLANFICGGWAFVWRAFLAILSGIGLFKLVKWWLLK